MCEITSGKISTLGGILSPIPRISGQILVNKIRSLGGLYKMVIGNIVAHLKPQKLTVLSDL